MRQSDPIETYFYSTAQGRATLNKGDSHKLIALGKFKTEREAAQACEAHYAKACKALANLGRPVPQKLFL
jgi:GH24 family phage-related lysozyme (muramidase)